MAGSETDFESAVQSFDRKAIAGRKRQAEQERLEVLQRFPIDEWPNLPLERYAIGQPNSEDTFGRWMEYRASTIASMKGGNANKHIIYKHKKKAGWYFDPSFANVQQAWESVRAGFVEAFGFAQEGQWNQIDGVAALDGGPALLAKSMYVYFPNEVLPICSTAHIKHFLGRLDPGFQDNSTDVIRLNRRLRSRLIDSGAFEGWSTWEMAVFLYSWADPRQSKRIFKIAPGVSAQYWDDCRNGGYICVGWDDVGDLREFESKDEFRDAFEAHYEYSPTKLTVKVNELWTLMELEPGDLVIANKGISQVLAVGEVQEPGYEFSDARSEYKHTVKVEWDTSVATDIEPQKPWAFTTVSKVPLSLYDSIVHGRSVKPEPVLMDSRFVESASSMDRKGQIILYGPPGTGKTYHARRMAVWLLLREEGKADQEIASILDDPAKFRAAENRLSAGQAKNRTWYMVANPKEWSWKQLKQEKKVDFHYGRLKRNYALLQPGDLVVGYESGKDKRITALARITRGLSDSKEDDLSIELEHVHDIADGLTYQELKEDSVLSESEPMKFNNQGTLFALTQTESERLFSQLIDRDPSLQSHVDDGEGVGQLTRITFHPSYSYEDFIEGFRPVQNASGNGIQLRLEDGIFKRVCRQAQLQPGKRFVVLVDEINRANISKVLGELITLLEKDKRGLEVTLSQSKEVFKVPPNVSILGTMNTADRSIRLLDAALRRRFAFAEMMPDAELLQGVRIGPLALDEFMLQLNQRISERFGREKQIGHSFFMDSSGAISEPSDFATRIREDVIPLLQEYSLDDYELLASLLGKKIVDVSSRSLQNDVLRDHDELLNALVATYESQVTDASG